MQGRNHQSETGPALLPTGGAGKKEGLYRNGHILKGRVDGFCFDGGENCRWWLLDFEEFVFLL